MKVFISVVPPGGGEALQSVEVELEAVPQTGDILVASQQGGETGRCVSNIKTLLLRIYCLIFSMLILYLDFKFD